MNAHGCELPADGAQRAAWSSTSISSSAISCAKSKLVGLQRPANKGCSEWFIGLLQGRQVRADACGDLRRELRKWTELCVDAVGQYAQVDLAGGAAGTHDRLDRIHVAERAVAELDGLCACHRLIMSRQQEFGLQ